MKLMYILRFLRGYVVFEIKGGFTERFINLCAVNRIHIWDVKPEKDSLKASILIKNFKKLRPVLRKSGSKIKILKKCGLPIFLRKNRNRIGLLISALFFIVFINFMNQFVWIVEVTGSETVSHEEIKNKVEELGLKVGTLSSKIDTIGISRKAVNFYTGKLLWMAINIKGSKAVIEVRDYIDEHEDTAFKDPCNLIADFNGTLISVEVFNGDQEAYPGNAVKKGDLLISGVIENRDMSCVYYEARGKITALHDVTDIKEYRADSSEYLTVSESKSVYNLKLFGMKIPLGFADKKKYSDSSEYGKSVSYNGTELPFGVEKRTYFSAKKNNNRTKTELLLALDEYTAEYYDKYKNTNILSADSRIRNTGEVYQIESQIKCIDFMGVQSPIIAEIYEN